MSSLPTMSTLKPGDEITVDECGYMYGSGTLWLRVTEIEEIQVVDGYQDNWQAIHGLQLRSDGSQLSHRTRPALVRLKNVKRGLFR
jgi:hypothetical protein